MTETSLHESQVAEKTLDDLKNEFLKILQIEPSLSIKDLRKYDSHFNSPNGIFDFHNAKRGKTSFDKIRKIVNAANKHIAANQETAIKPETIRQRQKLIPS